MSDLGGDDERLLGRLSTDHGFRERFLAALAPSTTATQEAPPTNARLQRWQIVWQAITAAILAAGACIAIYGWISDSQKRRTDRTLDYINKLADRDFINSLWDVHEFTVCFERHKDAHISYLRYDIVTAPADKSRSIALARDWWKLVENESVTMEECGKPVDVERTLMVVYTRLEALASCSVTNVCDFDKLMKMIEAFDYLTVLSISNYILLALTEQGVSREWSTTGSFKQLVSKIEDYVFNPEKLVLTPAQREQIWAKESRCERPPDGKDGLWRWCMNERRPPI
jgi:hypothetical protein